MYNTVMNELMDIATLHVEYSIGSHRYLIYFHYYTFILLDIFIIFQILSSLYVCIYKNIFLYCIEFNIYRWI